MKTLLCSLRVRGETKKIQGFLNLSSRSCFACFVSADGKKIVAEIERAQVTTVNKNFIIIEGVKHVGCKKDGNVKFEFQEWHVSYDEIQE